MEDGQRGCDHRKDDKTTSKVDAAQEDLCHPYSDLDFLVHVSVLPKRLNVSGTYNILRLLLLQRSFMLLKVALFPKGRAQDHARPARRPWWRTRRLQSTLERTLTPWCWGRKVFPVGLLHFNWLDVAKAYVRYLWLWLIVIRGEW